MSIYTKTGDQGETSLFGGIRIKKNDQQVKAYGVIDELSSFIGLVISTIKTETDREFLTEIQRDLHKIMAILSGSRIDLRNQQKRIIIIEKKIDAPEKKLLPLRRFILPQGGLESSWFHVLRTVCRRAERSAVGFVLNTKKPKKEYDIIIKYLNRLSDYFFVMARVYNRKKEIVT